MLDVIIEQTNKYIEQMPKKERKKYGQFFTSRETAEYMAGMFSDLGKKEEISILDAGAGSGILSCALLEKVAQYENIKKVRLVCYETDEKILDILRKNLELAKEKITYSLEYIIKSENYISSQYLEFNDMIGSNPNPEKYDFVIGNPPYMKIPKDALEAKAMPEICYGAPNLYFLFAAMGLFNLKREGEMVYIIPRSWTSGAYFRKFRDYFLTVGKLEKVHLFGSRNKVFDQEDVLQETMIINLRKTDKTPDNVIMTSTVSNKDFSKRTELKVPYNIVVSGEQKFVYLVTEKSELDVLKRINKWTTTLPDIGLRMKTGLTVDFKNRDILRNEDEEGAIPLFYSQHIKDGMVYFPIQKENEYVVTNKRGLLQKNKNYLFVKRFTAKEERRRLQCGVYLAKKYPQYDVISTQNKINFIDGMVSELSECIVYGLYAIFNSSIYDAYYRILNGSTQVNSTEINAMPVPGIEIIQEIGWKLIRTKDLSESTCDKILEEYYG